MVGLDGGFGRGDLLTGGGISAVGSGALLGVVQLAQLNVGLLDGILLAHIGGLQLGNLRQTLGLGNTGLGQIGGLVLQSIKKSHVS